MYYVLRTHNSIESPWGFSCSGVFKSKKIARKHCIDIMKREPTKDRLLITKSISYFMQPNWNTVERKL